MKLKKLLKRFFIAVFTFGYIINSTANNVVITNSSVSGNNITFNISWENSWNITTAPANWDAVWVVVKYQDCATREWAHANLSTLSTDHTAGSPLMVDAVSDGRGVFIRRAATGAGNISNISVTLKMNIVSGTYNYKVLGIEMVNIPSGNFYAGDGYATQHTFSISSSNSSPRLITSTEQSNGFTIYTVSSGSYSIPNTYPLGVNALYCMKYEITQQQYVDFLNSLTLTQQVNRTTNDPASVAGTYALVNSGANRNGIAIMTPTNGVNPAVYGCNLNSGNAFNSSDDGQNIACNFLGFHDLNAYLDWAALRPMTEFEYEKICKGPLVPISQEYPWGNTTITAGNSANLINAGTSSEGFSTIATGLCNYNNGMTGPVRSGFAATGASGRATAGATYYGVMEMGGNVSEQSVSIYQTTFNGTLGDGNTAQNGFADVTNWLTITFTVRGGSYASAAGIVRASARGITTGPTRSNEFGGRGVR